MRKRCRVFSMLIICAVLALSSCQFFTSYVDIDGVTTELSTALHNEYGLILTDSDTIIGGHMDVSGKDPCVQVVFCISENDLPERLDDKWIIEDVIGPEIEGQPCIKSYYRPAQENKFCRDAYLYHTSANDNGEILVLFDGANPSMSWIN